MKKALVGILVFGCVLLLMLARLESWSTSLYHWGNWWGLLWPWPALCLGVLLFGLGKGIGRLLSLLPLLALGLVWWFEIAIGRTTASPWWLGHSLIAATLLGCSALLVTRERRTGVVMGSVVLFAWVLPWVCFGASQRFWYDCNRLRLGMSREAVFEVMEEYFVWRPMQDGEIAVRDLDAFPAIASHGLLGPSPPSDIAGLGLSRSYPCMTFDHGGDEADLCIAYFDGPRLVRYWTWPD